MFVAGSATGITASLFLVVVFILALATSSNLNGFSILYYIFMIVGSIIMIITFGLSGTKDVVRLSKVTPEQVSTTAYRKATDSAEELLKLKKLLDAGAITQEEYEDKRKKYVESL